MKNENYPGAHGSIKKLFQDPTNPTDTRKHNF